MIRLLFLLLFIISSANTAFAAFPIKSEHTPVDQIAIQKVPEYAGQTLIKQKKKSARIAPAPYEDAEEEGISAGSIISFVLPLLAIAFFAVYTPVTAPVVAIICAVVGIPSILLADDVISNEKKGKALAIIG
ncbi:MAG: hypothetical protein EOP56_05580 [Sphingobacteriales bacterium]|nr:MAG: hypothetical protein EOP56_05580 [Sphingobacteriales bacterium]